MNRSIEKQKDTNGLDENNSAARRFASRDAGRLPTTVAAAEYCVDERSARVDHPGHWWHVFQTLNSWSQNSGPVRSTILESVLPLAQETLTRTIEMVEGESIVYVTSDLQ